MNNLSLARMEIIRAGSQHLESLARLFDDYREFYAQPSDLAGANAFLSKRMQNQDSVIFLASVDDQTVGFAQLYPTFCSVRMGNMWIVSDLFVAPEGRRRGVGRALLERARQHAVDTGAVALTLQTAVSNLNAQSLYEAAGWIRDEQFYTYSLDFK